MREHPNLKVFSNLMDAHFYIFEKWVVDFIAQDNAFSALKGEVLPYLVKKQFSKANISKQNDEEEEIKKVTFELGGFESFIKTDELEEQKQKLSMTITSISVFTCISDVSTFVNDFDLVI